MFKSLYNLAVLQVSIKPESALLVKGMEAPDPIAPDMAFIRMSTPKGETVFVPGSSLKGVVRSFAESLLRSLREDLNPPICDPSDPKRLCSEVQKSDREKKAGVKLPYERHCLACRTFGSTDLAARVAFSDFMPIEPQRAMEALAERPGVSINRRKGTVEHGPFYMEVLTQETLQGTLTFTNYQLWQLGLVLWALELMDEGLVKMGFAKSRGPGWVHPRVEHVTVRQFGPLAGETLAGVGLVERERDKRGLLKPESDRLEGNFHPESNGLWTEFRFKDDSWQSVAQKLKKHFTEVFKS